MTPVAYILSVNINRRHLTKGQRAMAVAMIYPEKHQGKKTSQLNCEANREYVRMARIVLAVLPELAKDSGFMIVEKAVTLLQSK